MGQLTGQLMEDLENLGDLSPEDRRLILVDPQKPVIWTKNGNVNVDTLEHYIQWQENGQAIVFREVYKTPDGEIVREDVHVYKPKGLALEPQQAST